MHDKAALAVLDTYHKAGAFGLLCAARLAVVGDVAGSSVAAQLDRVVKSMGGVLPGLNDGDVTDVRAYYDSIPVLDDVEAPVYYSCTAAELALEAMSARTGAPPVLAFRLAGISLNAWKSCDDILARSSGFEDDAFRDVKKTLTDIELDFQEADLAELGRSGDITATYVSRLSSFNEKYETARRLAEAVARSAQW